MLAKRNIRILKKLMQEKNYLTIHKLSKELSITTRAVRYDITLIDQFLLDNNMNKIEKTPNKGIRLALQAHELALLNEMLGQERKEAFILTKEERQTFLLDCLLKKDGVITLQDMADALEVSVSTINKDIANVKQSLEVYGITLVYKNKDYYALSGKEKDIRNFYSNLYLSIVHEDFMYRDRTLNVSNHETIMVPPLVSNMTRLIESMEDYFQLQLTDDSLLYMVSRLYVMSIRLHGGHTINKFHDEIKEYIERSNLYPQVLSYQQVIENNFVISLNTNELCYLTQYLLSARFLSHDESENERSVYFMVVVENFIQEVSRLLDNDFSKNEALQKNLLQHFEPMFNRIVLHTQIDNPLLDKIKLQFSHLYQAVKKASKVISDFCGSTINEEEIGYLCMHFGTVMNSYNAKRVQDKKVVIVCPSGYATSMMILTALETNYYVEVINVLPLRLLEKELPRLDYDYLISSVDLDQYNFDYIKVNPILSFEDILQLNRIFVEKLQIKNATLDKIMDIIKEHCEIKGEKELEDQLSNLLKMKSTTKAKRKAEKMLVDVINEDLIALNVEATDWKDAVKKGGQLLVDQGVAKESYVEAMIQSAINVGPYIVLEKGIALPHATPQDNTFKIGASIITLKTPVEFGHEENDPVSLVICLASIDSNSHMQVLADIGKIFDEEDLSQQIMNATSKQEVIEIITSISNS